MKHVSACKEGIPASWLGRVPKLLAVPGRVQEALEGGAGIVEVVQRLKEGHHALRHGTGVRLVAAAGLVCR